ncbi:MAG: dTDP-4-dehydrorhamnose reductase [Pseudomonadota bacterium]
MTILVFGRTGQVAEALARCDKAVRLIGRAEADLEDPLSCRAAMRAHPTARAVINAAAWTDVDGAEAHPSRVHRINADAPTAMAQEAAAIGIPFLQISTDYVFDGSGDAAHLPDAFASPISVYGESKARAEEGIRASGGAYAILRSSWVFSAYGANFVTNMLRLSGSHRTLRVVNDQIGGPTPAEALAEVCLKIVDALHETPDVAGTYHFSGRPDVSWAEFARAIFHEAGVPMSVVGIPSADYPTAAARPLNSRLDCSSTEAVFDVKRPDWRAALSQTVAVLADRAEERRGA